MNQQMHIRTYGRYYLQADQGGGGAVTGKGPWPLDWETFDLITVGSGPVIANGAAVRLRSQRGKYLSSRTGSLTADVDTAGINETFKLVMAPNQGQELRHLCAFGLLAANGKYVCAEHGGADVVHVNRDVMAQWETFIADFHPEPAEYVRPLTIRCQDNMHYFKAENGGGGRLDATSTVVGDCETFDLVAARREDAGFPNGAHVNIRTKNRRYLQAEGGGGGLVNASGPWPREWETFQLMIPSGGNFVYGQVFMLRSDNGEFLNAIGGGEVRATSTNVGSYERFTGQSQPIVANQEGVTMTLSPTAMTPRFNTGAWSAPSASDPSEPDYVTEVRDVDLAVWMDRLTPIEAPYAELVWPGSIVDGSTWPTGEYKGVSEPRKPITLTTSIFDPTGASSQMTINDPWHGTVNDALAQKHASLIAHHAQITARMVAKDWVASSEQQMEVVLGGGFQSMFHDLSAKFNFSSSSATNKHLFQFSQVYYTVSVRAPAKPEDWFKSPRTISPDEMYISSVDYGRMLIFMFESSESREDLEAAVKYAYNGPTSGSASVSTKMKKVLAEAKTYVLVIGGASGPAIHPIVDGYPGIRKYIEQEGTYTTQTLAVPLSYTMRFVRGGGIANVLLATSYKETKSYRATGRFKVKNFRLKCLVEGDDHDTDIYGWYWVASAVVPHGGHVPDPQDEMHLTSHYHTDERHSSRIRQNTTVSFGDDWETTFADWKNTHDQAVITVKGHLYFNEHDFLESDDDMGVHKRVIWLSDDGSVGTQEITFVAPEGDQVQLLFDVEPA